MNNSLGYFLPIIMIVCSNVLYNLFTKGIPGEANPFAALVVTYLTSAAVCFGLLLLGPGRQDLGSAFRAVNWTSVGLGASIVFLEFGYIQAYRVGWNISVCSLVANIALAVILLFIGVLFFREQLSHNQMIGIVFCLIGLFFVNKH